MDLKNKIAVFLWQKNVRGANRFYRFFCRGLSLTATTRHGIKLELNPNEYIDQIVLKEGYYESEVLEAIITHTPHEGCFWDIGANFGLHSLTAAHLRPDVSVIAFEPQPEMADLIEAAARENKLQVTVKRLALSHQSGNAELFVHPGNVGMSSLHDWHGNGKSKKLLVPVEPAGKLIESNLLRAPSLIKIDVEGHEFEALSGFGTWLDDPNLCGIVFEDGTGETRVKGLLAERGFKIRSLNRRESTHHNLENFLALR